MRYGLASKDRCMVPKLCYLFVAVEQNAWHDSVLTDSVNSFQWQGNASLVQISKSERLEYTSYCYGMYPMANKISLGVVAVFVCFMQRQSRFMP